MALGKHLLLVVFLFLQTLFGQSQPTMIVPSQPVIVPIGSDVTLPCQLDSIKNIEDLLLEWARLDLKPRYVHIRRERLDYLMDQNALYQGRTRLEDRTLRYGDMSLKLRRARLSDGGTYRCFIPQLHITAEVKLYVISVSPVFLTLTKEHSGSPVLRCESRGWFPEPELDWLDTEGMVLTTARTEVQRAVTDETFSIRSRVSVEQHHSTSFTCRVRQEQSGESREAQVQITEKFLEACPSCSAAWILFGSLLCFTVVAGALVLWRYKTKKNTRGTKNVSKLEKQEESHPMLKSGDKPNVYKQKLNDEIQEACSRITEEIQFIEESEKLLVSKEFLLFLKQSLDRCYQDLNIDIVAKQKKFKESKQNVKIKKLQSQIQKNANQMTLFRSLMNQTDKEISQIDDFVQKSSERKETLKEEQKQKKKLLENEKKLMQSVVQPEPLDIEVKIDVPEDTGKAADQLEGAQAKIKEEQKPTQKTVDSPKTGLASTREEPVPMLKSAEEPHEQKLKEYTEACLRITEELQLIEESDEPVPKEFLSKLKQALQYCLTELNTNVEEIQEKIKSKWNTFDNERNKQRQDKIKLIKSLMSLIKDIMENTDKEINAIVQKSTERKGKLAKLNEFLVKLSGNEKTLVEAANHPESGEGEEEAVSEKMTEAMKQKEEAQIKKKKEQHPRQKDDYLCSMVGEMNIQDHKPVKPRYGPRM